MSLRLKSLLIFSGTILLLFAIVLALVRTIIERQFDQIEIQNTDRQLSTLKYKLKEEMEPLRQLANTLRNQRALDGTPVPMEPSRSLMDEADQFASGQSLDFVSLWKTNGSLVDLAVSEDRLDFEKISKNQIRQALYDSELFERGNSSEAEVGLLVLNGRFAFVAIARLSVATKQEVWILGRFLTPTDLQELSGSTEGRIQLYSLEDRPSEESSPVSYPSVTVKNENEIVATLPLFNLSDQRIGRIELLTPRVLHAEAKRTVHIFVVALASSGGILLLVVWYLIDANVILPIHDMALKLRQAAQEGTTPAGLEMKYGGELADLAKCIEDLARAVTQAEANFRAIVEDQTDFIFRYHTDGKMTFVTDTLCTYLRRSRKDLLGSHAMELVYEKDRPLIKKAFEGLNRSYPVITVEHRLQSDSESPIWWQRTERAIFSEEGELCGYQSVARDITDLRRAKERMEASETRYRRLFENATDGILILRQDTLTVIAANPRVCQIFHCEPQTLIGKSIQDLPVLSGTQALRRLQSLCVRTESEESVEVALSVRQGVRRYIEVTSSFYDEREVSVIQWNVRDVTLRRRVNEELRRLSGSLMRLQDAERRRIARDLHDSTAQNLLALQLLVTKAEMSMTSQDLVTRDTLLEARKLCDVILKEVRTISYLLHPPLLDEVGLLFALRWYVDGFMTRTEKVVRLIAPDPLRRLPSEVETAIFRVVQEALGNIHRHSEAKKVWIRLTLLEDAIELEVEDNGKGFQVEKSEDMQEHQIPGVGIAGMRERLRQFGGKLFIRSSENGTVVHATIPLKS